MVKRFIGSGREQEGGAGATRKQDFNAHVTGGDWRHEADQIDVVPEVLGTSDVQTALETLAAGLGGAFVIIGDGFDGCTGDFSTAFNNAFADPDLSDGGTIIVKSGTYCMQSTVFVPNGISIIGDRGGVTIIGEMSEIPMFSFSQATVKNDIQPSVIPMDQFDDQNYFGSLKIYDNLNGNAASGGPSMSAVPMLQIQHGANLVIEDCNFIGRAVTGPVSVTNRVVGFTGLTSAGIGTTLHVNKCYIDGVKTAIDFDARQGGLDYLTVTNNRARTFGDGGLGTIDDRFFVTTTECNANISNNFHKGLSTTWGAEGCIHLKDIIVANQNMSFAFDGNFGGLDSGGTNDFIVDSRTSPSDINFLALSAWGYHHVNKQDVGFRYSENSFHLEGASLVTDSSVIAQSGTVVGETVLGLENLTARKALVLEPEVITVTDADNGSLTITYPYSSNIHIVAGPGLTRSTALVLLFEGEPPTGEQLNITVIQPRDNGANITGRITELFFNVAGSSLSPGFSYVPGGQSDYGACVPHADIITNFTYQFLGPSIGLGYYYVKTGESETCVGPQSFGYNWTNRTFNQPQKSTDVFKGNWVAQGSSSDSYSVTNPMFLERTLGQWKNGAAFWVSSRLNTAYLNILTPDGGVNNPSPIGAITGAVRTAAVREIFSGTNVDYLFATGSNIYRVIQTTENIFGNFTNSSLSNLGSFSNGLLYSDKFDDAFYWGDGNTLRRQSGPGGTAPTVSTTMSSNIVDICRSIDGDMLVVDFGNNYRISTAGLGNSPSWSASSFNNFGGPTSGCCYDRVRKRWIVIAGDNVWHSADINASTWVNHGTLPFSGSVNKVASYGNVLVAGISTDNTAFTTFSIDGGSTWNVFRSTLGLPPEHTAIGGFCYLNGKLIASVFQEVDGPTHLTSMVDCNRWGPLDQDK